MFPLSLLQPHGICIICIATATHVWCAYYDHLCTRHLQWWMGSFPALSDFTVCPIAELKDTSPWTACTALVMGFVDTLPCFCWVYMPALKGLNLYRTRMGSGKKDFIWHSPWSDKLFLQTLRQNLYRLCLLQGFVYSWQLLFPFCALSFCSFQWLRQNPYWSSAGSCHSSQLSPAELLVTLNRKGHWGSGAHGCLACPARILTCSKASWAIFVPNPYDTLYQVIERMDSMGKIKYESIPISQSPQHAPNFFTFTA